MIQILTLIAPLFLIIFTSALLKKFTNTGEEWSRVFNEFALKIGFPVLIFSALARTPFSFSEQSQLIIANSIFILVSFLLAIIVSNFFRAGRQMRRTLFVCFAFSNVAYLGIPVLIHISGEEILPTASIIVSVYLFWIFSAGIGYLKYSSEKHEENTTPRILTNLVLNPLLISVILGVIAGSLMITLPSILLKALEMISASVTPIVLVVIGLFIGKLKPGKLRDWLPSAAFSFMTLLVLPGIFYYGLKLFGFKPAQFSSSIIEAAMPLAITPFALADEYNLDKDFITRSIILSTILSVISLPFWISILIQ